MSDNSACPMAYATFSNGTTYGWFTDSPHTITGSFTIASGKGTLFSESEVRQVGNWVFIHISATGVPTGTTAIEPWGTLSGVPLPKKNVRGVCGSGTQLYNANHTCYFLVGTSGNITIQKSTSADTAINLECSYPVY